MKIAIVHDELTRRGGAEQVVLSFQKAFPQSPIYTMVYKPELTYPEFKHSKLYTTWFQKIAINEKVMKYLFFPIGMIAMMRLKIDYDIILISSTYCAKYPKYSPSSLVINYCHQPFRLAWSPESYKQFNNSNFIKKIFLNAVIRILRKIDFRKAQRMDYFIANSKETQKKIREIYKPKREVQIIHPPVKCANFYLSKNIGNYYLIISRLEYYKRIDLAIDAFNILGLPLVIVGRGILEADLKKRAKKNIIFKGGVSSEELAKTLSECKALIFPQHEDYGITPLEANASGRPVIAYGSGGVLETMIPYDENNPDKKFTAVFFKEQTVESLIQAIRSFESLNIDPEFIRQHSEKFDEPVFIEKIKNFVQTCIHEHTSLKGKLDKAKASLEVKDYLGIQAF